MYAYIYMWSVVEKWGAEEKEDVEREENENGRGAARA